MKPYLTFIFLTIYSTILAQQDPQFAQYMFNILPFNPAYAGNNNYLNSTLFYRRQWMGFENAPTISSFNINAPLSYNRMGLGLNIAKESLVAEDYLTIGALYAYKIKVAGGKLSFGLSAGVKNYTIDPFKLAIKDLNDRILAQGIQSKMKPDFGTGIFYSNEKFYAGFSALHLSPLKFHYDYFNIMQVRQYYLIAGYRIRLENGVEFLPSSLIKYTEGSAMQVDFTAHLKYKDIGWVGISYRTQDAVSVQAGFLLDQVLNNLFYKIKIAYAYDFPVGSMNPYQNGSHELGLILDYQMQRKKENILKRKITISPMFF